MEQDIHSIKNQKEIDETEIIKKLITNIPKLIKEKSENKINTIEFQCLRDINNKFRDIVSSLNKHQARCLDIAH